MIHYIGVALGVFLILLGFIGSVIPILPGPPLSFIGLLLYAFLQDFLPPLTPSLMVIFLGITLAVTVIDYLLPLISAKRYGTSKWGIYGSLGGMILGAFFSPFGMVLGTLIGGVCVEWLFSRKEEKALKAGLGIVVGSLLGMVLKLGTSGLMAYYLILSLLSR